MYVHRQLKDVKAGLRATQFPATTHRYHSVTEAWMSAPVPQGFGLPTRPSPPTLSQPTCTHPSAKLSSSLTCSLIQRVKAPPE